MADNPYVNLMGGYDTQLAQLQRQQQLAQALQQQSQEPIEILSYKGIQAPISPFSSLAKMLQAYNANKMANESIQKQGALEQGARQEAAGWLQQQESPTQMTPTKFTAADNMFAPGFDQTKMQPPSAAGTMSPVAGTTTPYTPQQRLAAATQGIMSANPYVRAMAPAYRQEAQQAVQAEKFTNALGMGNMAPVVQQRLAPYIATGDVKGAQAAMTEMSKPVKVGDTLQSLNLSTGKYEPLIDLTQRWHEAALSKDQQASMPPGTVKLVSSTGDEKYLKGSDAESVLRHQQHMGEISAGQQVAREKLAFDKSRANSQVLGDDETTALNNAIAAGKLDPARVSSRTAKIWGKFFLEHPNANETEIGAVAKGSGSPVTQGKIANMVAMPETVNNVAAAGKKLNYSDVQFLGKLKAYTNGQLNDPDYVDYMTQRADALQSISVAMRQAGATDQSTKLEAEIAHPSMSPRALDGWLQGQLKAALPKMRAFEKYDPSGDLSSSIKSVEKQLGVSPSGIDKSNPLLK